MSELTIKTGKRIRHVRKMLDMTQQELADNTGLTKTSISRIECGKGTSAENLLAVLTYYSSIVRTDIMLDDTRWEAALMEGDAMFRNRAVESILEAKVQSMNDRLQKNIQKAKNDINRAMNMLSRQVTRSTESVKSLIG